MATRRAQSGETILARKDEQAFIGTTESDGSETARTEILEAAAHAFVERGYAGTSIDDVADTLGSTKGRIYHYYQSKTDIIIDIHLVGLRHLLERVGAVSRRSDLKADIRLYAMCHEHVVVFQTTVAYQKATMLGLNHFLLSITRSDQEESAKLVQKLRDDYENLYVDTINDGMKDGTFTTPNARLATKPLLGALNWANSWFAPNDPQSEVKISDVAHGLATYCVNAVMGYRANTEITS